MSVCVIHGDCRTILPTLDADSFDCIVTSPPYWGLRDYGVDGQIGLEPTLDAYVETMAALGDALWRVLKPEGTFWLNLGDSYAGSWGAQSRGGSPSKSSTLKGNGHIGGGPKIKSLSAIQIDAHPRGTRTGSLDKYPGLKPKDLCGVPWRVAFALQSRGWWLRSAIIWAKPNGMPGSQVDRCTSAHETIFLLTKSESYWSDFDAIKTPPRESTLIRLAQDVQAQAGSHRANGGGKTNGPMKAVKAGSSSLQGGGHGRHSYGNALPEGERRDKQRGHSRRHDGFNDRWDAMSKEEQQSQPAMMRDVWFVPPQPNREAHFAMMPEEVARRCILAGCSRRRIGARSFRRRGNHWPSS